MIKPQYLIRNERESGLQKEKNHEIKINDHQLTEGKMLMEHRIYVLTMDRHHFFLDLGIYLLLIRKFTS